MASINFNVNYKHSSLAVRAVIRTPGSQKFKSTGETIPALKIKNAWKCWDTKKQRAKQFEKADSVNETLDSWENRFKDFLKECKLKNETPTIKTLVNLFQPKREKLVNPSNKPVTEEKQEDGELLTFLIVYDIFSKEKAGDVKKTTMKPYQTFRLQLENFEKFRGSKIIFSEVDPKFYKEFTKWLIENQNNVNSTINRKIKRLKTFMYWAMDEGYDVKGTFRKKFKLDEVEASKFPLYQEEKELFINFLPSSTMDSQVYWAFRFALETGLRYSDIISLSPVHIKHVELNSVSVKYLDIVEFKTSERSTIPLSIEALKILSIQNMNSERIFKLPSDQQVNGALKEIAKEIGLHRLCKCEQFQGKEKVSETLPLHEIISFHFARYTYITELLNSGLSPIHVQYNVGHSKLDTTLGYNRTIDKERFLQTLAMQNKKVS